MNLGTCPACGATLTAANTALVTAHDAPHYRERKTYVHALCPARCRIEQ